MTQNKRQLHIGKLMVLLMILCSFIWTNALSVNAEPEGLIETENTIDTATEVFRANLLKREKEFSIEFVSNEQMTEESLKGLFDKAVQHTGISTEGDYIRYQVAGYEMTPSISGYKDGLYYYKVQYVFEYYSSVQEEKEVTDKLSQIYASLKLDEKGDEEKIEAIYNYIIANVVYDHENAENTENRLKYTAYAALIDGKAVCQGYSVLLYRMLLDNGVDCRVVCGLGKQMDGTSERHAWNIVRLGEKYYNIDTTWDAEIGCVYYMVGSNSFSNHVADDMFKASSFTKAYPISNTDYETPKALRPINLSLITDKALRDYLSKEYDINRNGVLSISEISEITYIEVISNDVFSFECLEKLYWLRVIFMGGNLFRTIDASALISLNVLSISNSVNLKTLILPSTMAYVSRYNQPGHPCVNIGKCSVLENIYFTGKAPEFDEDSFSDNKGLTIYYPKGDPSWTDEIKKDYGGSDIVWREWDGTTIEEHNWDQGEITGQPTCTTEGSIIYTCLDCGKKEEVVLPAKGHQEVIDNAVPATKTQPGLTRGSHCSECGEVIIKQEIIPWIGLDHSMLKFYGGSGFLSHPNKTKLLFYYSGNTVKAEWRSANPEIATVDETGYVTLLKYGRTKIIASYQGEEYICDIVYSEIRYYNWWEYTGEPSSSRWVWDQLNCIAVGQSVQYKLVEVAYDDEGIEESQTDVTDVYPLKANNPDYFDIRNGVITGLKAGTSQIDNTSWAVHQFQNTGVSYDQILRINVFVSEWTAKSIKERLTIRLVGDDLFFETIDSSFYFSLDDLRIYNTDWYFHRCKLEELTWKSSDESILKINTVTGGEPNRYDKSAGIRNSSIYSIAHCTVSGFGNVEVSLYRNQELILTKEIYVPHKNHTWDEGVFITEGSCEDLRIKRHQCIECGERWDEYLVTGHVWEEDPMVEPTADTNGLTGGFHCSVCGKILVEQKGIPMFDRKGWVTDGDAIYYYVDKEPLKDAQKIDKKWYCFDKTTGIMQTGVLKTSEGIFYLDPETGAMHTGWLDYNGKKFYFSSKGKLVTGARTIDGKVYYFNRKGIMQTGVLKTSKGIFYLDPETGAMHTGWLVYNGKRFFFDDNGRMVNGVKRIDGHTYYFKDGVMQTGTVKAKGNYYYLDPKTGILQIGWIPYNGKMYYAQEGGILAIDCTLKIDGKNYTFNRKGICLNAD